ncbi:hypothetical protein [Domibacillus iocasae]|uniref:Uncharacterized protein n=1 Tax=Domibacillus iocasae TaxID=1714016 RepID=A0A1E7DRK9_9BACI|nr:hypothetical protein [Domibacillus iocasae]OES45338.1 hypothetical protein BA724_04855 [Domibacillus iocasae]
MNKKDFTDGFGCPEFVPPGAPDNFCIPEDCCPERLETPKFPSPFSCLPEEQLRELEALIDAANELLLDLALANERLDERTMKAFEGLINQWVEVVIDCTNEEDASLTDTDNAPLDGTAETNENTLPTGEVLKVNESKTEQKTISTEETSIKVPDVHPVKPEKKRKKKRNVSSRRKKASVKRRKARKVISRKLPKRKNKKKIRTRSDEKLVSTTETPNANTLVDEQIVDINEKQKVEGRVYVVGRDFVLLKKEETDIIIPLSKVHFIKSSNHFVRPANEPALLNIDPCLRRSLTFNFGETVASSPELIHIFFKMTLPVFLFHLVDKKVKILLLKEEIKGTVHEVDEETLTIVTAEEERKTVPFDSICFIMT